MGRREPATHPTVEGDPMSGANVLDLRRAEYRPYLTQQPAAPRPSVDQDAQTVPAATLDPQNTPEARRLGPPFLKDTAFNVDLLLDKTATLTRKVEQLVAAARQPQANDETVRELIAGLRHQEAQLAKWEAELRPWLQNLHDKQVQIEHALGVSPKKPTEPPWWQEYVTVVGLLAVGTIGLVACVGVGAVAAMVWGGA